LIAATRPPSPFADAAPPETRRAARLFWALTAIASVWVLVIGLSAAPCEKLTPDASAYLDLARQLARGAGFVLRYDEYQAWVGIERGAWFYQQPILPLVFSLVMRLARPILAANALNTVFAAAAVWCFALAWRRVLPNWQAALAVLPLAASPGFYAVYTTPLAEPLALFMVGAALWLLFARPDRHWLAGLLLGASVLLRAANLFLLVGLSVGYAAVQGRAKWREALRFALVLVGPYVIYAALGLLLTGELYPAYGPDARTFRLTRDFGGALYDPGFGLAFAGKITFGVFGQMLARNALPHLSQLAGAVGWFVFGSALLGWLYRRVTGQGRLASLLLAAALAQIVLLSLTFHFLHELEATRYAVPVLPFALPLAIGAWDRAATIARRRVNPAVIVASIVFVLTAAAAWRTVSAWRDDRRQYLDPAVRAVYFEQPAAWTQARLAATERLATNFNLQAFRFDRPVVSLPINRQLNETSLRRFLLAYQPAGLLVDAANPLQPEWGESKYHHLVAQAGYRPVAANERFRFYRYSPVGADNEQNR
jgi:hypothetical protein